MEWRRHIRHPLIKRALMRRERESHTAGKPAEDFLEWKVAERRRPLRLTNQDTLLPEETLHAVKEYVVSISRVL